MSAQKSRERNFKRTPSEVYPQNTEWDSQETQDPAPTVFQQQTTSTREQSPKSRISPQSPQEQYRLGPSRISLQSPQEYGLGPSRISPQSPQEQYGLGPSRISAQSPQQQYGLGPSRISAQSPQEQYNQGPSRISPQYPQEQYNQGPSRISPQSPKERYGLGTSHISPQQQYGLGPSRISPQSPQEQYSQGPGRILHQPSYGASRQRNSPFPQPSTSSAYDHAPKQPMINVPRRGVTGQTPKPSPPRSDRAFKSPDRMPSQDEVITIQRPQPVNPQRDATESKSPKNLMCKTNLCNPKGLPFLAVSYTHISNFI